MAYNEPCNSLSRKLPCSKRIPKNAITSFSVATQPLRKDKGSNLYPLLLWQFTIPLGLPLYSGHRGVTRCDSSVAASRKPGTAAQESLWLCGLTFIRGNVISSVTRLIPGISCSGSQTDTRCQRPQAQALRKGLLHRQKPRAASSLLTSALNKPRSL